MANRSCLVSCRQLPIATNRIARTVRLRGILVFMLVLACGTSIRGQDIWIGDGGDNRWDNPDNWALGEVPEFGEIRVNGPDAEEGNGPLIEDGIEAFAGVLIADAGEPVITMTGGSMELSGWGMWWGDAPNTTATFNMSGGVVDFVGNPGIMELGWQNDGDPPASSTGIWTMTGGEVNAQGIDMPGKNRGGAGIINLWGGTMNVGLSRGGLVFYDGAQLDITHGELVLEGDQVALVESYVDEDWVTAFGGDGELLIDFDGDYTTVTASNPLPGDYNGDRVLDATDVDLQSAEMKKPQNEQDLAKFDHNSDDVVSLDDRTIWVKDFRGTWIGDANFDDEFNSGDLVVVFVAGKYESGDMSGWAEGDWNGDMAFDSGDLVLAFADGGYEQGPRVVANVPEPSSLLMLIAGVAGCVLGRRCIRPH